MTTLALDRPLVRTTLLNVVLCAAVLAVPYLSHATAYPLYRLDPMRLLLFAAILGSTRRNALLMALWLPLFSLLTSGHPVFPKVVLIQGELLLNALLFYGVARLTPGFAPAAIVSVLASKAAYYVAKYLLLRATLLEGELVATPWTYQFGALLLLLAAGTLVRRPWRSGRRTN